VDKNLARVARNYITMSVIIRFGASFFFCTYVLFLLHHKMNFLQANLINGCFMVAVFLLEIPTGAIADTLGRKYSLVLSSVFGSISMIVYFLSSTFWGFVAAEFLAALGCALYSGAAVAWLKDSLEYYGSTDGNLDKKIMAKAKIYSTFVSMISAVLGAYLGKINLSLPWLCAACFMAISAFYVHFFFKEEYFLKEKITIRVAGQKIRNIAIDSVIYGIKNKSVFVMAIFGFALGLATQPLNMFWSPYFSPFLKDTSLLGWLWVIISLAIILGGYFSLWITKRLVNEKWELLVCWLVIMFGVFLSAILGSFGWIFFFFLIHEVGRAAWEPIQQSYLNKNIPSERRATVLSFDGMVGRLGAVLGLLISGWVAKEFSVPVSWLWSAAMLMIFVPLFFCLKSPKKK